MPLISVIVPIYNVEAYLEECVSSLIQQTLKDIEIILIDDGSQDRSSELCNRYEAMDARIRVIRQKNSGVSSARNKGLTIATGDYIIFVDADDWAELDMCFNAYRAVKILNKDVVLFDSREEYELKNSTLNTASKKINNIILTKKEIECLQLSILDRDLSNKNNLRFDVPWGKIISRETIINNQLSFNTELERMQDAVFSYQLYGCTDLVGYSTFLGYHYRIRKNSACRKYNTNTPQSLKKVLIVFATFIDLNIEKYRIAYMKKTIQIIYEISNSYYTYFTGKSELNIKEGELKLYLDDNPFKMSISSLKYSKLRLKDKIRLYLLKHYKYSLFLIIMKYLRIIKNKIKKHYM